MINSLSHITLSFLNFNTDIPFLRGKRAKLFSLLFAVL